MHYRKPPWLTRRALLGFLLLTLTVPAVISWFVETRKIANAQSAPFLEFFFPLYPFAITASLFLSVLCLR